MTAPLIQPPTRAYDMELLHAVADRAAPDCHGWAFGMPPGITPAQWPLDPNTGYPLVHGFTLLLPDDYRCHGPEIIACSFFAVSFDHQDGGTVTTQSIFDVLRGASPTPPDDPALRPYWQSMRDSHPRMHRMTDILDCEYALILLTQAEFDGPFCQPPTLGRTPQLSPRERVPSWLEKGSGRAFLDYSVSPALDMPLEKYGVYRLLGGVPEARLEWNRAIRWKPRAEDPNAGVEPQERYDELPTTSGYQSPHYYEGGEAKTENFRWRPWYAAHKADHIGGTMRPVQAMPKFSPFYLEFEEYFGGYNFGGGNCQIDILNLKLDWAC